MTTPAARIGAQISEVTRRLQAVERGPQIAHSSVNIGGEDVMVIDALAAGLQAEVNAALAIEAASSAEAKADGAVVVFYGSASDRSSAKVGDFYVNDLGQTSVYTGTDFEPLDSSLVTEALAAAQSAEAAVDGKVTTFFAITAPTAEALGDLWFDTDDGNHLYRWNGSTWADVQDAAVAAAKAAALDAQNKAATALTTAQTAQTTADGKAVTYFQTAEPTGLKTTDVGDLWFDTDDGNKMYRWSGTAWVVSQDQSIATAQTAAQNAANAAATADQKAVTADGKAVTAKTVADSKTTTYYQTAAPTTGLTTGDLWVDTDDGNRLYRWSGSAWVDVRDATIGTAQTAANNAQATANGKGRVYYQTTAPATGTVADVWFKTDSDNLPHKWNGSAWVAAPLGNLAVGNLDAGRITTGTLSGNFINGGVITGTTFRTTEATTRVEMLGGTDTIRWTLSGTPTYEIFGNENSQPGMRSRGGISINLNTTVNGVAGVGGVQAMSINGGILRVWDDIIDAKKGLNVSGGELYVLDNKIRTSRYNTALDWGSADIEIANQGVPRIAFHQPGQVASSLGQFNDSEALRTYNNAGNDYAAFYAYLYDANGQRVVTQAGDIGLVDKTIYFRGGTDANHRMLYSSLYDGPRIDGFAGVALWTSYNNRAGVTAYANNAGEFRVAVRVVANGVTLSSTAATKENVKTATAGLDTLRKLRPVKYDRTHDANGNKFNAKEKARQKPEHSFIAEELAVAFPDGASMDAETGALLGVDVMALVVLLTKSVQDLAAEVDAIKGSKPATPQTR